MIKNHWIKLDIGYCCSACHATSDKMSNYCPECGKRMSMPEQRTCAVCGKQFYSEVKVKMYCSRRCSDNAKRLKKRKDREGSVCKFSDGILCDGQYACEICGWNPKVSRGRILAVKNAEQTEMETEEELW